MTQEQIQDLIVLYNGLIDGLSEGLSEWPAGVEQSLWEQTNTLKKAIEKRIVDLEAKVKL